MSNTASIMSILACLVLGIAIGAAGSPGSIYLLGLPSFAIAASIGFILHWLIFIPSYVYQTEHYFDLTGSASYISIVLFIFLALSELNIRSILIGVLIIIWAIRLGSFLFSRVKREGKDNRFTVMKTRFWWYLFTWTLGGLWVFITMAAGLAAITSNTTVALGWPALIGTLLWITGFSIEIIADKQKRDFKKDTSKEKEFITNGLWAWSRHPNYFGEIMLWIGVTLIAYPVLSGWQLCTLISPIFVYVLLTKISGVNLLENRAIKKWGSDPDYMNYLEKTPVLIMKKPSK